MIGGDCGLWYDSLILAYPNFIIRVGLILNTLSANIAVGSTGGRFKNAYELLNLRALKISMLYRSHIFQCMGKIFCVEFQRVPLKFHTKYLAHTLKDKSFMKH